MTSRIVMPYREENGRKVIELAVHELPQLFNTFDPAPFHERDLDDEAEAYLVSAAREIGPHHRLKLRIHVEEGVAEGLSTETILSIHNFFQYRADMLRRELRLLFRRGRMSLLIGLVFLSSTIAAQQAVSALFGDSAVTLTIREWIVICGWVAMWRPFEIFLYDWWPIVRDIRIHQRLAEMEIEVCTAKGEPKRAPG